VFGSRPLECHQIVGCVFNRTAWDFWRCARLLKDTVDSLITNKMRGWEQQYREISIRIIHNLRGFRSTLSTTILPRLSRGHSGACLNCEDTPSLLPRILQHTFNREFYSSMPSPSIKEQELSSSFDAEAGERFSISRGLLEPS